MLLRVFATTDDSDLGHACLDWVRFLIALDEPVRIASATGAAEIMGDRRGNSPNPWARLSSFFATPLEDPYINLVATTAEYWGRLWAKRARKNIIVVPTMAAALGTKLDTEEMAAVLARYDHVITDCHEVTSALQGLRPPGSVQYLPNHSDSLEFFRAIIRA